VDEWSSALGDDTFRQLRLNSPATGRWFPALRDLSWYITKYNFPYADLFFSPHLERVSIYMSLAWRNSEVPPEILPAITSTISALPGPTLQYLFISVDYRRMPWAYFKESLSSVVLRCGQSLTEFTSPIPLTDAAVNHLIRLPHLRVWHIENPPPSYSASPLPLVFPPLTELTFGESAGCGWLSLFERLEGRASTMQGVTPLFRMKESLESLNIETIFGPMTNSLFASPIQIFRNLTYLNVEVYCHEDGRGQCTFKLNDDHVTKLAMALSQLDYLQLGHPCFENTCATTVACLLPISVYCVKLQSLEIHFNTTNIIEDFKNISEEPEFQELRSLPRCPVSYLDVYLTPLTLDEPGLKTVAEGMVDIFPSLEHCEGLEEVWDEVCEILRHVKASSVSVTPDPLPASV